MKNLTKFFAAITFVIIMSELSQATTRLVGPGQTYATIQAAINASSASDTVKVLPGVYNEAITIGQNIVVQGSGYETTVITSTSDPTITMSNGKVMWFVITSSGGDGIHALGGIITNFVIIGCTGDGVYFPNGSTANIKNSVIFGNADYGVVGESGDGTAVNCISRNNGNFIYDLYDLAAVTFSNGRIGNSSGSNNINADPLFFSSSDFRIGPTSPSWNTGNPADFDPDGSRSDMGYYGGFDAPIFPVVTDMTITLNPDGTVTVQAIGKSRF